MIVCWPTLRVEMLRVAAPLGDRVPVPRVVAPSWKVTFPVGAGATGVIVAVNVTDWPHTVGLVADVRVVVEIDNA